MKKGKFSKKLLLLGLVGITSVVLYTSVGIQHNPIKSIANAETTTTSTYSKKVQGEIIAKNLKAKASTKCTENLRFRIEKHVVNNKDVLTAVVTNYKGTDKIVNIPATIKYNGQKINVIRVAQKAFYNNDNITKVICNTSKTDDGTYGVERFSKEAFYGCDNLKTVQAKNLRYVAAGSFKDCKNLKTVTLSTKTKEKSLIWGRIRVHLSKEAFNNCQKLETVAMAEEYLGAKAFENCTSIKSFSTKKKSGNDTYYYLAKGVRIGENCFYNANVPYGKVWICSKYVAVEAFKQSNVEKVILGKSTALSIGCFENCKNLTNIHNTGGTVTLSKNSFAGCSNLISVELPKVKSNHVPDNCFMNCINVKVFSTEVANTYGTDALKNVGSENGGIEIQIRNITKSITDNSGATSNGATSNGATAGGSSGGNSGGSSSGSSGGSSSGSSGGSSSGSSGGSSSGSSGGSSSESSGGWTPGKGNYYSPGSNDGNSSSGWAPGKGSYYSPGSNK